MSSENAWSIFARTNPLYTPEILRIIFEFCPKDTEIELVCRTWRDAALPVLWREVPFRKVLALLPPLCITEAGGSRVEKFSSDLAPKDWDRFLKYAGVVRSMTFGFQEEEALYPAFLLDIVCSRPNTHQDIFPNLTRLDLAGDATPFLQAFGHEGLKSLTLRSPLLLDTLFPLLLRKHPNLEQLVCSSTEQLSLSAQPELAALLLTSKLHWLQLPPTWYTPIIVATLAQCVHLERLEIFPSTAKLNGELSTFPEEFPSEAFPVLRELQIVAPFDRACRSFSLPDRLPKLTSLTIHSFAPQPVPSNLAEITRQISQSHPNLQQLRIRSYFATKGEASDWFSTIGNIRTFSSLSRLSIYSSATIHLNLHNLVSLSQGLPRLEYLLLCNPDKNVRPLLDVSVLLGITPFFPLLLSLELLMDISARTFPEVGPNMKFQRLTMLNIGADRTVKIATNPQGLAVFLDGILPGNCQLAPKFTNNGSWTNVYTYMEMLRSSRIQ